MLVDADLSPQGEVFGSFAMYRQEPRGPNTEETRLTQIATHIAGIAIERQRVQETLRERDARINLAAESADLAFWVIYPEQNTAWMSDKGRAMYGFDSKLPLTRDLICSRVHPDERAAVHAAFDQACATQGSSNRSIGSFCLTARRAGSSCADAVWRTSTEISWNSSA